MDVSCQTFTVSKNGSGNHDACSPKTNDLKRLEEAPFFRCAIADGDAESTLGNYWAEQLVDSFLTVQGLAFTDEELEAARKSWQNVADGLMVTSSTQEKIAAGTKAAFLGVSMEQDEYAVTASGSCCFFHIRKDEILRSFPFESSDELKKPSSWIASAKDAAVEDQKFAGQWTGGDYMILTTAALAAWILDHKAAGKLPEAVEKLIAIRKDEDFAAFVESERNRSADDGAIPLADDDTTMVRVEMKLIERRIPQPAGDYDENAVQQFEAAKQQYQDSYEPRDFEPEDLAGLARQQTSTDKEIRSLRKSQHRAESTMDQFKVVGWILFITAFSGCWYAMVRMHAPHLLPF